MQKIQVKILGIFSDNLSNHPTESSCTLLLGEAQGDRSLSMNIGLVEAQAIALALEDITLERPLMHDLFKDTLLKLGYMVQEAVIVNLKDDIFFANLQIADDSHNYTLDIRPSDAIAITLRFKAPIFVDELLLNEAGSILLSKFERSDKEAAGDIVGDELQEIKSTSFENYSVQALHDLLAWVVDREEYEKAALIRDELKRRN